MSLRPPSLQAKYDDFFSGDPAIIPLPERIGDETDDALQARRVEWQTLIRVARETGDWAPVIVEGKMPARFTMKPLEGDVWRTLIDMAAADLVGRTTFGALAFRAAFAFVTDPELGNAPVVAEQKKVPHPKLGPLAPVQVANYFDAIDKRIVSELGEEVLRRARDLSPKS